MKKTEALNELKRIMRAKHYSLATLDCYSHWVGRFFGWLSAHPHVGIEPRERMEGFLSDLARTNCAAATQNQAFNAILFFYRRVMGTEVGEVNALRARRPQFVRHAPTRDQVRALLAAVEDTPTYPYRLILSLLYGCGLRVSEPLNLRLRDIDLGRSRLVIRQGKGGKDRMVGIPATLGEAIRRQIEVATVAHGRALAAGVPVKLPNRLSEKYRRAGQQLAWFWLFPAAGSCVDPADETGQRRVWWHCLPAGVQKAMRAASERAGLPGVLSPHHLRHAWATHAADAGASVRDIQAILGHRSLETTMQYVHPEVERVVSPLDTLAA